MLRSLRFCVRKTAEPRAAAASRGLTAWAPLHQSADFLDTLSAPQHKDTYYSRTLEKPAASNFHPLRSSVDADVVIIGGGLAGVNTALALAERGRKAVLLEAGRIGWAASGRNGGFAHPGYSLGMGDLVETVGVSHARALWNLTFDSMKTIRKRMDRWQAAGRGGVSASVQPGMLTCSWFDDARATAEDVDFGNQILGRDYFQFWDRARVRSTYATPRYYDGVYDPDSFHFHSLNYALEVASDARTAGAAVHEQSPAASVDLLSDGRKRVSTLAGPTVTADHVVLCGSAYLPSLGGNVGSGAAARVRRAVLPVMTYACVTEPLGRERLASIMAAPHAVTDSRFACDYYRPLPDTRILWGGRIDCTGIAADRLAGVLHADMCKVYPQLRDVRVEVAWSGVMGYAAHKMPLVGRVPASEVPGMWYCTGFGGHGVCPTTVAGELIARAIAEGDDTYLLFKPFGLQWAGGPLGAVGAQAFYWAYELRDWMTELRKNGKATMMG